MTDWLTTPQGRRIALNRTDGQGPTVIFLGGFRSDMEGTKALHLEAWARAQGRAFVRFDYSGHGVSEGAFEDGSIGDWRDDAAAVLDSVAGPAVLVGSSMGGWISLLLARDRAADVAGLVTIAAAPDFTEDGYWAGFSDAERAALAEAGLVLVPSAYGDPYPITRRLIEEGRNTMVLRTPLSLPMPARFLQGTADEDVDLTTAYRLMEHATGPDLRLTVVKGADHRFSDDDCLALIVRSVEEVLARAGAAA
ncbi:alpha/beta hydrolase [Wenxinia marina]|uniref:Palmitoyl-protein thioesterase ABHD10, mitochondrial n=1 Tax=Wenxinia marina DSM 24838 TaxID=1123501 RepID=A0A0D0Q7Q5_9RHOB|nr:alpha/beta fold hydrolase [Wenxinia marina]KIQ68497.1 putative hydrolase or acyltransferase (alpha/beta hydrolase superfamily) [Wenxinia marina DSM 24838]GGL66285.1 alpha/beta hydrolase [Wenxinia marina]